MNIYHFPIKRNIFTIGKKICDFAKFMFNEVNR